MQALCRPRQTEKTPLPLVADDKGGTWRPPVLPGDGPFGQFAYRGGRQSQADAKDFAFAVCRADGKKEGALTSSGGRQRGAQICHPLADGKGRR